MLTSESCKEIVIECFANPAKLAVRATPCLSRFTNEITGVMSLLSENIVPGDQGKVFGTNAKSQDDLKRIRNHLLTLEGVKDVVIDADVFPAEISIFTTAVIKVDDLQKRVMEVGFHVVPKSTLAI